MGLKKYITSKKPKVYRTDGLEVLIKDLGTLRYEDVEKEINQYQSIIPSYFRRGIKRIEIGNYQYLNRKDLTAAYKDGTIYISSKNVQSGILDDVVHETAHSVEELFSKEIYSDLKIEKEFTKKRESLWIKLKNRGFAADLDLFLDTNYNEKLDFFLYKEVGYPILRSIATSLFYSPYAATSLREYFSNAFEAFFLREDIPRLKRVSPVLYEKITQLMNMENKV